MNRKLGLFLAIAVATGGLLWSLGEPAPTAAQRQGVRPPFANAVEQRAETIRLLREIRDLLREQNALLKSGKVRVVVQEKP